MKQALLAGLLAFAVSTPLSAQVSQLELQDSLELPQTSFFYGHGTESPLSLAPGELSFTKTAGQDAIESSFIVNSLNIGLFENVQIGTTPFFWVLPGTKNISGKVTAYRSKRFNFGVSYFYIGMDTAITNSVIKVRSNSFSFISNYKLNSAWTLGYQLQLTQSYFSISGTDYEGESISPVSHYLDLQYQVNDSLYLTGGVTSTVGPALLDTDGVDLNRRILGFGGSATWKSVKNYLSFYPSLGAHYYPSVGATSFVVSLFFN